ncbi:hypothetical protein D3C75_463450 [compost metagenome]
MEFGRGTTMSEAGKVSLPMTPERIEEIKEFVKTLDPNCELAEWLNGLLAALEEAYKEIERQKDRKYVRMRERDDLGMTNALMEAELLSTKKALEEAQQDLECFHSKTAPESLGYGAKWKQNALTAREERDSLRGELAEAQQTIARQREALRQVPLLFDMEDGDVFEIITKHINSALDEEGDTQP